MTRWSAITRTPRPSLRARLRLALHDSSGRQPQPARTPRTGTLLFYPATRALCPGWNQASAPRFCGRLTPVPKLLVASRRLELFVGRPTVLARLTPRATANL